MREGGVGSLYSSVVLSPQGVISPDVLAVQVQTMRALERVHIFEAAGCGSTTLGQALAYDLECQPAGPSIGRALKS
jgi:hypothetical protein